MFTQCTIPDFAQAGKPIGDIPDFVTTFSRLRKDWSYVPEMMDAVKCLRSEGIQTAILTNNWQLHDGTSHIPVPVELFDVVSQGWIQSGCLLPSVLTFDLLNCLMLFFIHFNLVLTQFPALK